jgi:hypothetical protein
VEPTAESPLGAKALVCSLTVNGSGAITGFTPATGVLNIGTSTSLQLGVPWCAATTYWPTLVGTLGVSDLGVTVEFTTDSGGDLFVGDCGDNEVAARFTGYSSDGSCVPVTQSNGGCTPAPQDNEAGWDDGFDTPANGGEGLDPRGVYAIHTLEDSSGIVVGGRFEFVGSDSVEGNRIAVFDGSSWSALGSFGSLVTAYRGSPFPSTTAKSSPADCYRRPCLTSAAGREARGSAWEVLALRGRGRGSYATTGLSCTRVAGGASRPGTTRRGAHSERVSARQASEAAPPGQSRSTRDP